DVAHHVRPRVLDDRPSVGTGAVERVLQHDVVAAHELDDVGGAIVVGRVRVPGHAGERGAEVAQVPAQLEQRGDRGDVRGVERDQRRVVPAGSVGGHRVDEAVVGGAGDEG